VTAPNGGESWTVGASQDITWTATDNVGVTAVDIAYSTDGGATYPNTIETGEANDGTYTWTVPDDPSATCRVKIVAQDAAGNDDEDASDADFTIAPDTEDPVVTVTAPNGGESWTVGASQDITWTATDNVGVTAVDIAYSTDGGASYTDIATGEANDGTYTWTVPDDPSATCRVKIVAQDAAGNDGEDASDADFTIALAPTPTPTPTPAPVTRRGGGGGAPQDTDGDGYSDLQELGLNSNPKDPCDPYPGSAACSAIRPPTQPPAAIPTATPAPTVVTVPPPAATPATPTPEATEEPGGILQAIPGFEAIFVVAGALAVAFLLLRRKRK
jgi:hypothetical protein